MPKEELRKVSTVLVESKENAKTGLVQALTKLGVDAAEAPSFPVDWGFTADGHWIMGDNKTPEDLIASVEDGRLHQPLEAMKNRNALACFNIEGDPWSEDGIIIGYAEHAWDWERFDNLLLTLQLDGAVILHSSSQARTPMRIARMHRWAQRKTHGSYHSPVRPHFSLKEQYIDPGHRAVVESLMAMLPGAGEVIVSRLVDKYPVRDILGITPDGLLSAAERWQSVRGIGAGLTGHWIQRLNEDYSDLTLRG